MTDEQKIIIRNVKRLRNFIINIMLWVNILICLIMVITRELTYMKQSVLLIIIFTFILIKVSIFYFKCAKKFLENIDVVNIFVCAYLFIALLGVCTVCNYVLDGIMPYIEINSESNSDGKNQQCAKSFSSKYNVSCDEVAEGDLYDTFEASLDESKSDLLGYLEKRNNLNKVYSLKVINKTGTIEFRGNNAKVIEKSISITGEEKVKYLEYEGELYMLSENMFEEKLEFDSNKTYILKYLKDSKKKSDDFDGKEVYMNCAFWEKS